MVTLIGIIRLSDQNHELNYAPAVETTCALEVKLAHLSHNLQKLRTLAFANRGPVTATTSDAFLTCHLESNEQLISSNVAYRSAVLAVSMMIPSCWDEHDQLLLSLYSLLEECQVHTE